MAKLTKKPVVIKLNPVIKNTINAPKNKPINAAVGAHYVAPTEVNIIPIPQKPAANLPPA